MHPLPKTRRRELAIYRSASRLFGPGLVGAASSRLYRLQLLRPTQKAYYILSREPLVIYIGNVMRHSFEVAELFRHRRVKFIKNFYHTFERPDRLAELKKEVQQFWQHYPQHTLDFMCATRQELAMFESAGLIPCHHINKNAFVDEGQYRIIDEISKDFDAIYNGQLAIYKRHELAAEIESLALIVYRHPTIGRTRENDEHGERIRELLSDAAWLNDVDNFIAPKDISKYLNRARVGLALSAEEGPMAACMEYFLSGLPVVSTPSLGGRDEFFDDDYVKVVDPDPGSVARGVEELIHRDIEPQFVRDKTIARMKVHRSRFIKLVNSLLEKEGAKPDFDRRFRQIFVNKLRTSAPFPGAMLKHAANGMPVELCRKLAATTNA